MRARPLIYASNSSPFLAHDLRNPLASIDTGINMLLHRKPDVRTLRDIGGHGGSH
jgi:signal transduction histidine kinase